MCIRDRLPAARCTIWYRRRMIWYTAATGNRRMRDSRRHTVFRNLPACLLYTSIKDHFYKAKSEDENRIAIIEVGGTVGDIESQPFLEAIRQFQHEIGHENAVLILSLIHI